MKSFLTKNLPLVLVILLAAILRFYALGQNPPSLFVDEVSNGYNAYSILKTGRDEYGNFLPLVIRSFGDYNPALSAYLLIPSIAVFGLNEIGVRVPSAFLGTLTILSTYFLVLKLAKNKYVAYSASFLLAISPWHLQFSRYDHEANFMLFFTVLGLTIFLYSEKKLRILILSAISFGLAINSYQGAKIWVPVFLLMLFLVYHKEILSFKSKLIYPLLVLIIFSLPIALDFKNSLIRGQSVGIFEKKDRIDLFIHGYLSHYSPNFLFISGDSQGRHAVPGMGQLYVFELPLILAGLIFLLKDKTKQSKFILAWLLAAAIPAAVATPTPHALRAITFLPVWSIVAAYGTRELWKVRFYLKVSLFSALALIAAYNVITYFHLYYKHYPSEKAPDWSDGYKEMVNFVSPIKDNYDKVAMTNYYGHPYIFVLFYSKYDPAIYQKQKSGEKGFDKYEFFASSWDKNTNGKILMIRPAWQIPSPAPNYIKFIYSTSGDLTFRISEE